MRLWLVTGSLARSSTRRHPPTWCAGGGEQNITRVYRAAPQGACEHGDVGVWVPQTRTEGASPRVATCVCGVWRAGVDRESDFCRAPPYKKSRHARKHTRKRKRGRLHDCARTCAPPQHCVGHCTLSGVTVLVINNGHARQLACARAECNCTRCWAECTCVVSSRYGTLAPSAIHPPHARSTTPTARTTQLPRAPNPPSVYQ